MRDVFNHQDGDVIVEALASGKNKITVELHNDSLYMPVSHCETGYTPDLIDKIMRLTGPDWLCDEIQRDESPYYVQNSLKYDLLSYVEQADFKGKRLLDFGCGGGASTMILSRMFPETDIVGVELEESLLEIARLRCKHYGTENIELLVSPNAEELPRDIGTFDYIIMSAVFEHLLPNERIQLLPKLWSHLKPGGVLFLDQTPYRFFPVETHTTSGLPLINYLPDGVALFCTHHLSKRKLQAFDWDGLLRLGIRGGSVREIMGILESCTQMPQLLSPTQFGMKDRIDLWYQQSDQTHLSIPKKVFRVLIKLFKGLTGVVMLPYLALAIKKEAQG